MADIIPFGPVYKTSDGKMLKLAIALCLLAVLVDSVISSDVSASAKVFHFTKVQNEDDAFNFEYTLDNGEIFIGRATPLHRVAPNVYVMTGADNSFYWARFSDEELLKDSFDKTVNDVRLDRDVDSANVACLEDDEFSYYIQRDGNLKGGRIIVYWDVDNVAFHRTDVENVFDYVISSTNTEKEYRSRTTYTDDPHIQTVFVPDYDECYLFQVTFTDDELNSSQTIYKLLDKSKICEPPAAAPGGPAQIDPNLLKSMTG